MKKIYKLYPPFLCIPEEENFSDVWEAFCLKLLKIEFQTNNIERRKPPEQGVDLYFKEKKIAFQCKSNLKDTKFNITNAKNSLLEAKKIQNLLPWETYYLCSNINLTGIQMEVLQQIYSNIEIKGQDYWVGLCKKNYKLVQNDFRSLIGISNERITKDLNIQTNFNNIDWLLNDDPINILLYSEKNYEFYELNISKNASIKDLLKILRCIFNFGEFFSESNGQFDITHFFMHNDNKYFENSNDNRKLADICIENGSILTYWIRYSHRCNGITHDAMNFNNMGISTEKVNSLIKQIFNRFNNSL